MDTIKEMQKKMLINLLIVVIVISIVSFFVMDEPKTFIIGLVFGSSISALNFLELASTLKRAVLMTPGKAQGFTVLKYFVRYIVTAIVIYISIIAPYINVLGTIVGLFVFKVMILIQNTLRNNDSRKKILQRKEDESGGR